MILGLALALLFQFGEAVEVAISNVEVVVTDAEGRHIHGLTAADFEVYDNGALQPVTNFSEYRGAAMIDAAPATATSAVPVVRRPIAVLLFIDNLHLQLKTRNRALEAVQRFLEAHPDDPLSIIAVRFNGSARSTRLRGSAREVAASIPQLFRDSADELVQTRERRRLMTMIDEATTQQRQETWRAVLAYAESVQHETRVTADALRASVDSLSGFDGRKIVMFISDGLPQVAAAEAFKYWQDRFRTDITFETLQYDQSRLYRQVAAAANAAGVTMYTLDATGVTAEEGAAVDHPGFGGNRVDDSLARDNRRGPLGFLADETGGAWIRDQNVLDPALASFGDDLRDYYSIGYRTPPGNKTHKISVRVKREGLHARARQQYVVPTSDERVAARIESMFVIAGTDDNPLHVKLSRAAVQVNGKERLLPIMIRVPREGLTAIEGAHVTLFLEARDEDGAATPIRHVSRPVPAAGDLTEPLTLTMNRGEHAIVVAVRDDVSGSLSLVRVDVQIH
jgi:VWFA-related protein